MVSLLIRIFFIEKTFFDKRKKIALSSSREKTIIINLSFIYYFYDEFQIIPRK